MISLLSSLLLLVPLINDASHLFSEGVPWGVAAARELPPLNRATVLSGRFQKVAEERAKKESGLWLPLVRLGNEVYARIFSQISPFFNRSVLLAHSDYLFQPAHLGEFNRHRDVDKKKLIARVKSLKKFVTAMEDQNKSVVLIISPNLISMYPDLVPEKYLDESRVEREGQYEILTKLLEKENIPHIDALKLLKDAESAHPFRFFARSASHWNDVASCLALRAINEKLVERGGPRLRRFSCDSWHIEETPRDKDRDLLKVANLWNVERLLDPTPYVDISFEDPEVGEKPRVLLVGTSYLFAIHDHLVTWGLVDESVFYFYYRSVRRSGSRAMSPLRKNGLNWTEVLDRDIFIINVGMNSPGAIGYGFLDDALKGIKRIELAQRGNAPIKKDT